MQWVGMRMRVGARDNIASEDDTHNVRRKKDCQPACSIDPEHLSD